MIVFEIEQRDDVWYVQRGLLGGATPITQAGRPAVLGTGWVATRLVSGLAPANVLELRHISGRSAAWYLNPDDSVKTNDLEQIPDPERSEFIEATMRSLGEAWRELIAVPAVELGAEARHCLQLGGAVLRDAVRLAGRDPYPRSGTVHLGSTDSAELLSRHCLMHQPDVSLQALGQLFARNFLNDAIQAATAGRLVLPSPIDGQELTTDIAFCLTHSTIAYRFTDARYNLTFYVVASLWRAVVVALYFPSLALTVYASEHTPRFLSEFFGTTVDVAMFNQVLDYGIELEQYLLAASRSVTFVYSQEHLGHHLWNELTGLDAVATRIAQPQLPEILLIPASGSEMYGNIDKIFPELTGRVDRTPRTKEALTHFAYQNARCLFYPTSDHVSADLGQRIIALAERDPAGEQAEAEAVRLTAQGFLIVMLGLRVENRTLVDSVAFFLSVIAVLRERSTRVAVVIDGHNATSGGQLYRSHAENLTEESPAEVELSIVEEIRARFADDEDVQVISTVGRPMSASIVWCRRAAFFVTPWGAGLAKYRWVCNQRGLVVASQRFFRHAGARTVHLYDSPQFMEAPTPLNFVSPDDVEDAPDAPLLIGLKDENRINFTVKPQAIRMRLLQLMLSL